MTKVFDGPTGAFRGHKRSKVLWNHLWHYRIPALTRGNSEPPIGIEPMTYALRVRCSTD